MLNPFSPGTTVSRTITGTTASVALPSTHGAQIMVTSPAGGAMAFIKFGPSTVEAAVTDVPIMPGTVQIFTVPLVTQYVAGIGTAGTTLYFTSGDGQ